MAMDESTEGLSAKEIYKLKLKKIAENDRERAKQEAIEAEERAIQQAEL